MDAEFRRVKPLAPPTRFVNLLLIISACIRCYRRLIAFSSHTDYNAVMNSVSPGRAAVVTPQRFSCFQSYIGLLYAEIMVSPLEICRELESISSAIFAARSPSPAKLIIEPPIIQGFTHAMNLLPFKNYDGEGLLRVIQNKPDGERYVEWQNRS